MSTLSMPKSVYLTTFSCCLGLLLTSLCFAGQGAKKPQSFQSVRSNTPQPSSSSIPRAKLNQAVLSEFDVDENGKLSRKEKSLFIKAMRQGTIESEVLSSMLIEYFDQNKNGKLERKEIAQMQKRSNNRQNSPQTLGQFRNLQAVSSTDDDDSTDTDSETNGMCEGGFMGTGMPGELTDSEFPPPPPRGRRGMNGMGQNQFGGQQFNAGNQTGGTSAASFGGGGRGGGRGGRGR